MALIKIPLELQEMRVKMVEYLDSHGVDQDDYEVTVGYRLGDKLSGFYPYQIDVVYHDEPDVTYHYRYEHKFGKKRIALRMITPLEPNFDDYKHYIP